MKHQKTTFVLAIACALCATPATASIKEECKQIKEKGETQISDWFLKNKQIAEHNKWWRDEGQEIFNKCLKKNDFGDNLDICIHASGKIAPHPKVGEWDQIPLRKVSDLREVNFLATIYTAFCKR